MEDDDELKRIRLKRLREMFKRSVLEKSLEISHERSKSPMNKPVNVTDSTFKETVQNHALAVIDCWAAWCAPCRMIAPIIEELAQKYAGRILFGKLNVDENQQVSMQYQIMSIPTLLVFKNGKLVDRIIGALPRQLLEPKIVQYL
jgi:thioredoxin 1